MLRAFLNFVLFQAAWFACVLAAARGLWLIPPLAAGAAVGIHLALTPARKAEAALIARVTLIGLAVDVLLIALDIIALSHPAEPFWLLHALWFASLWAAFATTLNASLRWLRGRMLLAAVFGAIGGPLAYLAGQRLGAVSLPRGTLSFIILALEWACLMPPLVHLASRLPAPEAPR